MAIDPLWYTTFQEANTPGRPGASMAGVYVTPNAQQQQPRQQPRQQQATPFQKPSPYLRSLAQNMMTQGSSTAPVRSPLEGLARSLTGLAGGYFAGQANEQQQGYDEAKGGRLASLLGMTPEEAQGLSSAEMLGVAGLEQKRDEAAIKALTKQPPQTWRPATTQEITAAKLPAAEPWQISSRGDFKNPTKPGQVINVGGKAEETLFKELVKGDAARIKAVNEEVDQLRGLVSDLKVVDAALEKFPSGALAPAKLFFGGIAESLGFDVEGIAEGQLANAVISKLIPRMRPSGSGTTSDPDMALFRAAVPGMGNTVEGNRMMIRYFDQMMKRKAAEAEFLRGYAEESKSLKGATEAMIAAEERGELAPAFTEEEREALLAKISEPQTSQLQLTAPEIASMTIEDLLAIDEGKLTPEQEKAVGKRLDELTPDL